MLREGAPAPVLVVDDDPSIVELVRTRLELAGIPTLWAYRGADALEHMRTQRIAAVLLDVGMPGLNGFEVLSWMKRDPRSARIPVLMLTGCNGSEDVARALALGAKDYLTKPFSEAQLLARVQRLQRWTQRSRLEAE